MPVIELFTSITAPPEICFDLARDIDLHVRSTPGTNERAVMAALLTRRAEVIKIAAEEMA